MNPIVLIIIYGLMLAFDLSVLVGTAYLVEDKGWSSWWFLVAFFICAGSNPRRLILAAQGITASPT